MENNSSCPVKGCIGKLLCTTLPVFIFLFAAGYVVNHLWLMPMYQRTAAVWRPMSEMKDMMPWMLAYYAVLSLAISALFYKVKKAKMQACDTPMDDAECKIGGKKCPIKCGICFGGVVGVLLGTMSAVNYVWLPIPGELAIDWFISWVVQGMCIGVILMLICHCKNKKCSAK